MQKICFKACVNDLVEAAKHSPSDFPVRFDHCFARILLDQLFQDVWYKHLKKPAYKHLSTDQLERIKQMTEMLLENPLLSFEWNRQSLLWRGKLVDK